MRWGFSAAQHLSMKLTHPQNMLKKREKLNMTDDHIAVKVDGVIYVKLDDVKPMRARIAQLETALREIRCVTDDNRTVDMVDAVLGKDE